MFIIIIIIIMLILLHFLSWKTFTYPLDGVELDSVDEARKFILARMMFPIILILF